MHRLSSRKLAAAVCAMGCILAEMLGLAIVQPSIFTEAPEIVALSMLSIAGLGGFVSWRQSIIDEKTPTLRLYNDSTVVERE